MIPEALAAFFAGEAFLGVDLGAVEPLPSDLVFFAVVIGFDVALALGAFAIGFALVFAVFFDLSTGLALPATPGRLEDLAGALLALEVFRFLGATAFGADLAAREAEDFLFLEVDPEFFVVRTIVLLRTVPWTLPPASEGLPPDTDALDGDCQFQVIFSQKAITT